MKNPQLRHWMITIWPGHLDMKGCSDAEIIDAYRSLWDSFIAINPPNLRWLNGQIERSPETGQLHIQAYSEWTTSYRRNEIPLPGHKEGRKGSREDARDYCRKATWRGKDKGLVERLPDMGEWRQERSSGGDSPKKRALALLAQGLDPAQILKADPEAYFTHSRSIDHFYNIMKVNQICLSPSDEEE